MKIPTTLDRKARKKWLTCSALAIVLALLLVLSSLPVYAGEQQTEQTETPTVTQDAGSESAQSETSSEQSEPFSDELEPVQPIEPQEPEVAATDWTQEKPHEGQVLHGGYVGFKNVASGKYLSVSNGNTTEKPNVIQYDEVETPNAQEFLLEYTYSPISNEAYFRIFSVTANGTKSNPVKSVGSTAATANVRIDSINYLLITDRWQIEHAYDNYYYIYLAHNPDNTETKYALTAYGTGNGTSNGTSTTSQGNVFVSLLDDENDCQLWQICVDGISVNLNGINIADDSNACISLDETVEYYYIPPRFNAIVEWIGNNGVVVDENGIAKKNEYGVGTLMMSEKKPSTGFLVSTETSEITVMPSEGRYFISNASTIDYLGATLTISSIVPLQIAAVPSASLFYWDIQHDEAFPGYFTIRSVYNGLYLNVDSNNPENVLLSYVNGSNTFWKVESGNLGNAVLRCRTGTASNDTLVLSEGNGGELLSMTSYVSDTQHYDEWDLYLYSFDYSVYHYYDSGFDVRFPDDDNSIDEYQTVCTNVLLASFGVYTVFQTYEYYSCADNCSGLPITLEKTTSLCDCGENIDHKTKAQLRADLIDQFGEGDEVNSRYAWTGHYTEDERSNSASGSHTVVMAVKEADDTAYQSLRHLYLYTLLHEISHQLGAPDHYCYNVDATSPCTNPNCYRCTKMMPAPICLMSGFMYVEFSMMNHSSESMYCESCKSFAHNQGIGTHLLDHH